MLEGEAKVPVILAAAKLARDQLLRHDEALRLYEAAYHIKPDLREIRRTCIFVRKTGQMAAVRSVFVRGD